MPHRGRGATGVRIIQPPFPNHCGHAGLIWLSGPWVLQGWQCMAVPNGITKVVGFQAGNAGEPYGCALAHKVYMRAPSHQRRGGGGGLASCEKWGSTPRTLVTPLQGFDACRMEAAKRWKSESRTGGAKGDKTARRACRGWGRVEEVLGQ